MMTRPQRIEYEILGCAMNGSRGAEGYTTTLAEFLSRLQELFPGVEPLEFKDACRPLVDQNALRLRKLEKEYCRGFDDVAFFIDDPNAGLHFHASAQTPLYFRWLSAFIDMPAGFKRRLGPARRDSFHRVIPSVSELRSHMNCSTRNILKLEYQAALKREREALEAKTQAVTQMQQEIASTQVQHRVEERKKAEQILLDHCKDHRCGIDVF